MDLLTIPSVVIAQQLTLIEFEHFSSIKPIELTDHLWKKDPARCANVSLFINRFNECVYWVAGEILGRSTSLERSAMLCKFVRVAGHCKRLRNYHTLFAVSAGVTLFPVDRLKEMKNVFDRRHQRIFDSIQTTSSTDDNYHHYRKLFDQCVEQNVACIPHLAVSLKDLFLLELPTQTERSSGLVDMNRLASVTENIDRILVCTKRSPVLTEHKDSLPQTSKLAKDNRKEQSGDVQTGDEAEQQRELSEFRASLWQQMNVPRDHEFLLEVSL